MMSRLVSNKDIGKISNIAWGLGYLGGMIVLIFVVAVLAASPETGKTIVGISPGIDIASGEDARLTGPIAAIWYLVFVLPMFMFTPDSATWRKAGLGGPRGPCRSQGHASRKCASSRGIFRFLVARMIYQDGVNALLALGAPFAAGMFAWQTTEMGLYGIMLNVVAIFGCIVAGYLDTALRLEADRHVRRSSCCCWRRSASSRPGRASRCSASCNCRRPTAADCSGRRPNLPISATAC